MKYQYLTNVKLSALQYTCPAQAGVLDGGAGGWNSSNWNTLFQLVTVGFEPATHWIPTPQLTLTISPWLASLQLPGRFCSDLIWVRAILLTNTEATDKHANVMLMLICPLWRAPDNITFWMNKWNMETTADEYSTTRHKKPPCGGSLVVSLFNGTKTMSKPRSAASLLTKWLVICYIPI